MDDTFFPADRQYIEQIVSQVRSKGTIDEDGNYLAQLFDEDDIAQLVELGGVVISHTLEDERLGQWRIDVQYENCHFFYEDFRPLVGSIVGH